MVTGTFNLPSTIDLSHLEYNIIFTDSMKGKCKFPLYPVKKAKVYNLFYYDYSITKCTLLQFASQGVEQLYFEIVHLVIKISSTA